MTLRFGPLRLLSGFAQWSLLMAAMLTLANVPMGTAGNPTVLTGAGMLTALAVYDTVVRWRHGGEFPSGRRHTIAASVIAGALAVTLTTVAFLNPPF